ncbi:MAG: prefoldin subunit alpha [Thermoplasmata archaeon]|nr:MAG: prefoldin subunit alpha [Thermoplasmata archaeon]
MANEQAGGSKEDEIREAMMRLELIKTQLESLSQQSELFELTSNELERAKKTLSSIKDLDDDKEILIPIGGDTFIYSKISDVKKILIGVGAGTIIEQDIDDAILKLEDRLNNVNKTSQNIFQTMTTLQQQAADLNFKIQTLSKELEDQVSNNVSSTP